MQLKIGDKAPLFSLYNTEKNLVNLHDLVGKKNITLLFFPLAFTTFCTKEMCYVRDSFANYRNIKGDVLAISVDSIFTLDKFKHENDLPFHLLSDFNREASRAFGTLYSEFTFGMKDVSKRAVFIIDKAGIIQYQEILESAGDLPKFDIIEKTLEKLS